MKTQLVIEGKTFDIGHQGIVCLMQELNDPECLKMLAQHPAYEVRMLVARNENTPVETLQSLADDTAVEVIEALVDNYQRKDSIKNLDSLQKPKMSLRVLERMASDHESYLALDQKSLTAQLLEHPDPSIRAAYASNHSTDRSDVKQLTKDPDPDVRYLARENLEG